MHFNLASDDSKSLSFYGQTPVAADTISSQNKAWFMWTLVGTWNSNVAGHVSLGSLIRHCDSHLTATSEPALLYTQQADWRENESAEDLSSILLYFNSL